MKHAYVTGTGGAYRLRLSEDAHRLGYGPVCTLVFERYRAAQDIANTIHRATCKATQQGNPTVLNRRR